MREKKLGRTLTRREFLTVSGVGVAGASLLAGCELRGLLPRPPDKTPSADANVVLIILDSLRKDQVGAYGNDWIETPNLDALAGESLRFSRAYPESAPTICARRAIHTGLRTWPFTDWQRYKGIDTGLQGWQPIPNDQTTLAETLQAAGYGTMFVTDNLQQYDASMNFHRGFDAYDFIRGQTTDSLQAVLDRPSPEKIRQALIKGKVSLEQGACSTFSGTSPTRLIVDQKGGDWFAPQVFTRASEFLESTKPGGARSSSPWTTDVPTPPVGPSRELRQTCTAMIVRWSRALRSGQGKDSDYLEREPRAPDVWRLPLLRQR